MHQNLKFLENLVKRLKTGFKHIFRSFLSNIGIKFLLGLMYVKKKILHIFLFYKKIITKY